MQQFAEAEPAAKPLTFWQRMQVKAAMAGVGSLALVGAGSASVNFTTIQELIASVTDLIPSFMDLVIEIAPLNE